MKQTVGRPLARVDGHAKVTGTATYTADHHLDGLTHGVLVVSTIARGRITRIDTSAAAAAPGFVAAFTHENFPRYHRAPNVPTPFPWGKSHYPLQDDVIHYAGQHVAFVVAETLEQARFAAGLVRVEYDAVAPSVRVPHEIPRPPEEIQAPIDDDVIVEATYTTPMNHHNTMEPSATTAAWDGDRLTLYDAAQSMSWIRTAVAATLAMPVENVRIVVPYIGGAFGCKGLAWPHVFATAAVAREVGRPVKLVLTRAQTYTSHGHRSESFHSIRLTSGRDGRLSSIRQTATSQVAADYDHWLQYEGIEASEFVYRTTAHAATWRSTAPLNLDVATSVRPPEGPGNFVLECGMDELAHATGVDPLELRLRNYNDADPDHGGEPYGSRKFLRECYEIGAKRFGWSKRKREPRSTRKGDLLIGQGMAGATHLSYSDPARARVRITPDGRAVVQSGTQEIGGGTYTTMTQVATDAIGMAEGAVRFELGDTNLPTGPTTSGSMTSISVGQAVHAAGLLARGEAITLAIGDPRSPLHGLAPDAVTVANGKLHRKDDPKVGETIRALLSRHDRTIDVTGAFDGAGAAGHSWGAAFAEVQVDVFTGEVRVTRLTAVFDCGRILNEVTARSQGIGGAIWGIGFALTEHTLIDANLGRIVTPNLAGYLIPVELDVPALDIQFVNRPDPAANVLGVRGMGEVVACGVPAAIANAVFHATGRRVRDLPITPDKLL